MKPATIRRFDLFFLAWVLLTILDVVLRFDAYVEQVLAAVPPGKTADGAMVIAIVVALWIVILLALWALVSFRRSVVAKWLIVFLVIIGVFGLPNPLRTGLRPGDIVPVLAFLASVGAAYSLFGRGAKAWFARADSEDLAAAD